ncbi:hypothetical protein HHI36_000619 [Cryptolaemus montrouzieri]|uniref:PH domain-containing protein n=1 Tax=Cryptolaemus montrouzieri TaxID=559131 RepID=A0ABD2P5U1_9CUCU
MNTFQEVCETSTSGSSAPENSRMMPVEKYIDVNQRILLPNDYTKNSQIVKLTISMPKVMIIDSDENEEKLQEVEMEICEKKKFDVIKEETSENIIEIEPISLEDLKNNVEATQRKNHELEEMTQENSSENFEEERCSPLKFGETSACPSTPIRKSFDSSMSELRKKCYRKYISDLTSPSRLSPDKSGSIFHTYNVTIDSITPRSTYMKNLPQSEGVVKAKVRFFENAEALPKNTNSIDSVEAKSTTLQTVEEKVKNFFDKKEYKSIEFRKFPFSTLKRPMSKFDTFKKYLEKIDNMEGKEDSEIIRELVMSRYRQALKNFVEKSGRKKRFSINEDVSGEKSPEPRDSGNNSVCEELSEEDAFHSRDFSTSTSIECEMNRTYRIADANSSGYEHNNEDSHEYDENVFLDMALGSELEVSSNTIDSNDSLLIPLSDEDGSIGTSHLSQLISGAYDLYSTVDRTAKKNRQSSATYASITDSRGSVGKSLASIEEIVESESREESSSVEHTSETDDSSVHKHNKDVLEKLMNELQKQACTIMQVSKAIDLCSKVKELNESIEKIEAERILLIATIRKEILIEEMTKVEYEDVNDMKNGFVRLSDLSVPLTWSNEPNSKYTRFFVCLFRCGATLYSSGVLLPDEDMMLKINKSFCFEELPADFEINFEIYSIYARISHKGKNSSLKSYKDCSNLYRRLKHLFSPKRITDPRIDHYSLKRPSFILYGKSSITRTMLQQKEFKLKNIYPKIPLADVLRCSIDSFARIFNHKTGFLSIGEKCKEAVTWNTQWCILESNELKFWNYPGKENEVPPNKTINLTRCLLQKIQKADKELCPRPRSLYLEIGPQDTDAPLSKEVLYLSTDNEDDFNAWQKELNSVLTVLIQWGCMKSYFYRK